MKAFILLFLPMMAFAQSRLPTPIKLQNISQYTCLFKTTDWPNQSQTIEEKFHFYYHPNNSPMPIWNDGNTICHDSRRYGTRDSYEFPRFELITDAIHLWDSNDPMFFDNDGNGNLDINDYISKRSRTPIPSHIKLFVPFTIPSLVHQYSRAGNDVNHPVGYLMGPWVDQATFKSYCLNAKDYESSNPIQVAFGEILGRETEGLYIGESIQTAERDYILLNESDIKNVWFHMENGKPLKPTEANTDRVTVFFYYPLDKKDPFVKKAYQKIFRVRAAQELPFDLPRFSYPSHDRKIGCIPKIK